MSCFVDVARAVQVTFSPSPQQRLARLLSKELGRCAIVGYLVAEQALFKPLVPPAVFCITAVPSASNLSTAILHSTGRISLIRNGGTFCGRLNSAAAAATTRRARLLLARPWSRRGIRQDRTQNQISRLIVPRSLSAPNTLQAQRSGKK